MTVLEGSCVCGGITYTSTAGPQPFDYCYCTICQQTSGSPFMAFVGVPRDALSWKGKVSEYRSSDIATRLFCSTCSGALGMQYDCYPNKTHIAAGSLKTMNCDPPGLAMHLFVKSKPAWYEIPDDGVDRHDEFPEEFLQALRSHEG
ncbi:hypothetical protein K431DRAFT_281453 [Polychaeton citri CBS 116435]|uniref:CENP-V/GFA domain-containing protein n=1 Tax=Polychaeton citri CBS 116435 TaxID=1314669 RepID=A0A9P4UQW7_9PEZI|nr:hypothetical protein K431DRAFT_281453 [Polychaeton citri CBS 116435]